MISNSGSYTPIANNRGSSYVVVRKITRHKRNRWSTAASAVQPRPRSKLIHSQLVGERREDYEYPEYGHNASGFNRAILRSMYKEKSRNRCDQNEIQYWKFYLAPWLINPFVEVWILMPNIETSGTEYCSFYIVRVCSC